VKPFETFVLIFLPQRFHKGMHKGTQSLFANGGCKCSLNWVENQFEKETVCDNGMEKDVYFSKNIIQL